MLADYANGYRSAETVRSQRQVVGDQISRSWVCNRSEIAYAQRLTEGGTPVADVCRQIGISDATFYTWKKKFAEMGVSELRKLKQLEAAAHRGRPHAGQAGVEVAREVAGLAGRYNHCRPHGSLGHLTPSKVATKRSEQPKEAASGSKLSGFLGNVSERALTAWFCPAKRARSPLFSLKLAGNLLPNSDRPQQPRRCDMDSPDDSDRRSDPDHLQPDGAHGEHQHAAETGSENRSVTSWRRFAQAQSASHGDPNRRPKNMRQNVSTHAPEREAESTTGTDAELDGTKNLVEIARLVLDGDCDVRYWSQGTSIVIEGDLAAIGWSRHGTLGSAVVQALRDAHGLNTDDISASRPQITLDDGPVRAAIVISARASVARKLTHVSETIAALVAALQDPQTSTQADAFTAAPPACVTNAAAAAAAEARPALAGKKLPTPIRISGNALSSDIVLRGTFASEPKNPDRNTELRVLAVAHGIDAKRREVKLTDQAGQEYVASFDHHSAVLAARLDVIKWLQMPAVSALLVCEPTARGRAYALLEIEILPDKKDLLSAGSGQR